MTKVTRTGGGFDKLRQMLKEVEGIKAKVGWKEGETYPDSNIKVSDVAIWQEYGTYTKPPKPRPFVRLAISENSQAWVQCMQQGASQALKSGTSLKSVLSLTADLAVGDVKQTIKSITSPPNAPSTIKRKGFNTPLIDSGVLWQTVTYEVESE